MFRGHLAVIIFSFVADCSVATIKQQLWTHPELPEDDMEQSKYVLSYRDTSGQVFELFDESQVL